jgi:deoxyribose-phosphate aldolase
MEFNLFDKLSKEKIDSIISGVYSDISLSPDQKINFSAINRRSFTESEIASAIDHTILKANVSSEEIRNLCLEAKEYKFASVCVNPAYVQLCVKMLEKSTVKVCTVIGFPLGANETIVKRFEAEQAINNGAQEIDMVINISRLKDGDYNYLYKDISEVVEAAKLGNALTKVIIETCYLTDEEKIQACMISSRSGADFVKTSTGFGPSGAKAEDVALMKYLSGNKMKVKASGGIRTKDDAELMLSMGADRLGTSSGVSIIKEIRA